MNLTAARILKDLFQFLHFSSLETAYLEKFIKAEEGLSVPEINVPIFFMPFISFNKILKLRNINMGFLSQKLGHLLYKKDTSNHLFFIITVNNRDALREKLKTLKFFAPVHWPESEDKDLAGKLLSIPIDQRITSLDMCDPLVRLLETGDY